jgi:hypothetical protein
MFGMEIPYSDLFTRTVALDLTNRHVEGFIALSLLLRTMLFYQRDDASDRRN